MIKEACVETFQEALNAEARGAGRIELCAELDIGGITPSYALIESVMKKLHIPVMVMIRPRGGNFLYTTMELRMMKQNIDICKSLGAEGIVLGMLDEKINIDINNTALLTKYAAPLQVTFHKAIDETNDLIKAVKALSQIQGITRILTSGGKATALEGAKHINDMIQTVDNKLTILAAGRITDKNLPELSELLHTNEFHGRRIVGDLL